ncbi:hypothetical protein GCM10018790_42910 [Kitasatospora xanthocidica]|nr:hypothetical protein GCM10018790_42910 [Kitasatospora xanthocidica]
MQPHAPVVHPLRTSSRCRAGDGQAAGGPIQQVHICAPPCRNVDANRFGETYRDRFASMPNHLRTGTVPWLIHGTADRAALEGPT